VSRCPNDPRTWVRTGFSVDDAREFALALQEASRLIKEHGTEDLDNP
jgi:hypothetical protein